MLRQIEAMAQGMEKKIEKNSSRSGWVEYDEGGNRIWNDEMVDFLKVKMLEEVYELFEGMMVSPPELIFYEACDVANIAMMLADIHGGMPPAKGKSKNGGEDE